MRCGLKKQDQTRKVYVHMLNGTLCATERALCCLVENWQTPEVRTPYFLHRCVVFIFIDRSGPRHPSPFAPIHARARVPAVRARIAEEHSEEIAGIEGSLSLLLYLFVPLESLFTLCGGALTRRREGVGDAISAQSVLVSPRGDRNVSFPSANSTATPHVLPS